MSNFDGVRHEAKIAAASKSARLLTVAGIAAIIISLLFLSIRFQQLHTESEAKAKRFEAKASALDNTVREARRAMSANNLDEVRRLLRVATINTQELTEEAKLSVENETVASDAGTENEGNQPVNGKMALDRPQIWKSTVYIQFAGQIDRDAIRRMNADLRKSGWVNVQSNSGERIETATGLNQIRYHGEEDGAAAMALATAVSRSGVPSKAVDIERVALVRPGVLEVWISR